MIFVIYQVMIGSISKAAIASKSLKIVCTGPFGPMLASKFILPKQFLLDMIHHKVIVLHATINILHAARLVPSIDDDKSE